MPRFYKFNSRSFVVILTLAVATLSSLSVSADGGIVRLSAELLDTVSVYEPGKDEDGNDVFELVNFKGSVVALMLGQGIFEGLQKLHKVNLDGDLPKKEIGEIDHVSVSRHEGNLVYLKVHSVEVIEVNGDHFQTDGEIEYKITKGTWRDYERGKTIRLSLTENGAKTERELNQKTGEQLAELLLGELRQLAPKDAISKMEVQVSNSNDDVLLSKKRIIMKVKQSRLDALLEVLISEPDEPIVQAIQ